MRTGSSVFRTDGGAAAAPAPAAERWFALCVKPRHEKRVAHLLRRDGWESFAPLYSARRRWSDRWKTVEFPLFPTYVFCRFPPSRHLTILRMPGVRNVVKMAGRPAPVDEREIAALQEIAASGLAVSPAGFLRAGQRVRIENGPLFGLEGAIESDGRGCRLIVSVTLLQRCVAVEIESSWVRPVVG